MKRRVAFSAVIVCVGLWGLNLAARRFGFANADLFETLAAWSINGALLGAVWLAFARGIARRDWVAAHWVPLVAGGGVALGGFLAFGCYFAHPLLGKIFSGTVLLGAGVILARDREPATADETEWRVVPRLQIGIGLLYLALLHVFPTPLDFYSLTANRILSGLPVDNRLPHEVAVRLYQGDSLKPFAGDWLSSDRPPLQSGWELLVWPVSTLPGISDTSASGTAAVWFQLLWVAAAYGLLRALGLAAQRAALWTTGLALAGFFLLHTLYVWPKLSAGALACGAFALWVLPGEAANRRVACILGALLAGLAWLTHGGVAFSLIPLAPWVVWRAVRGEWREWTFAAAVFAAVVLPWTAYQKFYDPPGNRLLKWHLAGQVPPDARGTWETLRANYGALSAEKIQAAKVANLRTQFFGDWKKSLSFSRANAGPRRNDEFFYTGRAFTWWAAGLALLPLVLARRESRHALLAASRAHLALTAWAVATLVVWCLLIFQANQAIVHQGSFAAMIALFALFSAWIERAGRGWILAVIALQIATLLTTWTIANETVHGPVSAAAVATALFAVALLARSFVPFGSAREA